MAVLFHRYQLVEGDIWKSMIGHKSSLRRSCGVNKKKSGWNKSCEDEDPENKGFLHVSFLELNSLEPGGRNCQIGAGKDSTQSKQARSIAAESEDQHLEDGHFDVLFRGERKNHHQRWWLVGHSSLVFLEVENHLKDQDCVWVCLGEEEKEERSEVRFFFPNLPQTWR